MEGQPTVLVVDTSVMINFIHAGRLDILGRIPTWRCVFPEEVAEEITCPNQAAALADAVRQSYLERESITDPQELRTYTELRGRRIGKGEAACLAMAVHRGWTLASDERGRFLRVARELLGTDRIVNTPGILLQAIRTAVVCVNEADAMKTVLERKRFRMTFRSFRDLLSEGET